MRLRLSVLTVMFVCILAGCGNKDDVAGRYGEAHILQLNEVRATLDNKAVEEFDTTWHMDPSREKEWIDGADIDTDAAVYIAHDIWYYPELDEDGFVKGEYNGDDEWLYYYTAEDKTDYIFATLPYEDGVLPVSMMHSASDAYENKVLHINKPGTYILQGQWRGQIFVNLGDKDKVYSDEEAKVTLVMNGVEATCDVAPVFIAYSAYECDNGWKDKDNYSEKVDTSDAGVKIVLADGSVNEFTGTNIFRMLKPEYKKDSDSVQKKAYKIDGAFYSYVSMNIESEDEGTGMLNLHSGFEGISSDMHLTINGGNINIYAQNDGINVNKEDVSVFTMNAGTLHVFAGLGAEGDAVDSNGYIVVNDGIIAGGTPSGHDELLDSNCGNIINGGELIGIGSYEKEGK